MDAIDALRERIPDHSEDLRFNLHKVLTRSRLSAPRVWGCAITAAVTGRHHDLTEAAVADARAAGVAEAIVQDARAAASSMAMSNVYYRFKHTMESAGADYAKLPAGLRMKRIARPAGAKIDFELFALVASVLNGCECCVRAHERVVREGGLSPEAIHDAVRVAATIHAAGVALGQGG